METDPRMEGQESRPHTVEEEWDALLKMMRGLFPTNFSRNMTPEMRDLWKRTLGAKNFMQVKMEIEIWAAHEKYFPKPGEIRKRVEAKQPKKKQVRQLMSNPNAKKEVEQEWREGKKIVDALTYEQRQQHKQSALKSDWRIGHLKDRPVNSRAWQAIIIARINRGLEPDQIDETPVKKPKKEPDEYEGLI